ncbi:MAG: hypothetical protein GF307_11765 [candidate division Zixibacteria bacterium]|nr:hypothetical protein [candidate division Zixibacteria bacterium]
MKARVFTSRIISLIIAIYFFAPIGIAHAGKGFLYICHSGKTYGATDTDTCYTYAQNTIRPALDHWLNFYHELDLSSYDEVDNAYFNEFDGIIIAPFTSVLIPDSVQQMIAEVVDINGVGLINCDPYIDSLHSSLFDLIPVYYKKDVSGNDSLFVNPYISGADTIPFPNVKYIRENRAENYQPVHWINEFGYENEKLRAFFPTVDSLVIGGGLTPHFERFFMVDSVESSKYGKFNHPRLKPLLIRDTATEYPLIYAGYSPSGNGRVWTLTCPPDWWSSAADSAANGWSRHGTMSDILWRGLAYTARGGLAIKAVSRYIALTFNDAPPHTVYDSLHGEFVKYQMVESVVNRGIPLTFKIFTDPKTVAYDVNSLEYLRGLQNEHGCSFLLQCAHDTAGGLYWVNRLTSHNGSPYDSFTVHTDSTFKQQADSIAAFEARTGIEFDNTFSAHYNIYDYGSPADSFPVYRWLKQRGLNRTACIDHPLNYSLWDFTGDSALVKTKAQIQDSLPCWKAGWYPAPFGSNYWFQDFTDTLFNSMFGYSARDLDASDHAKWNWQKEVFAPSSGTPDSCGNLDAALHNFKRLACTAFQGGVPAYVTTHAYHILRTCQPRADTCFSFNPADSVYWTSMRWDSLMGMIHDWAAKMNANWIGANRAFEMVDNLNRYDIVGYTREGNVFEIALAGSTYAPTELMLYCGEGGFRAELPINIPPFNGNYDMTIIVNKDEEGYYAEIY